MEKLKASPTKPKSKRKKTTADAAAPTLAEVQNWLSWVVTDSRGVAPALRRPDGEPQPRCLGAIVEAEPLTKIERLDVYAEAYYSRLLECLELDFPALKRVLGEDIFRGLVAQYLEAHPSRTFTANSLGEQLPEFMKSYELSEELPYLPDLARLEWATVDSFFAKDHAPFDPARLDQIAADAWPRVRLKLDSSVVLLHSHWNVDDMSNDEKQPASEEERWLVVSRQNYKVRVQKVEPLQFRVLELLSEGMRLGELCTKIEESLDIEAVPPPLMDWFKTWMEAGFIRDLHVK